MPQAILTNSFRAQDALRSGIEVVAFLGTSLLLQEQILWICRRIPYPLLVFAITGWAARANGHFPIALPATTCHGCPRAAKTSKREWQQAPAQDSLGIGHRTNFEHYRVMYCVIQSVSHSRYTDHICFLRTALAPITKFKSLKSGLCTNYSKTCMLLSPAYTKGILWTAGRH